MGPSAPPLGTVLQDQYVLEQLLGDTAGYVYRARRKRDGRSFIVRVVVPALPPLAAEFLELAGAARRIRHPTLASIEDSGRFEERGCFLVAEYVEGQRLDAWADAVGIPPLAQVVELVRRLCVGLQAAARGGLAHDALNPRNVIVLKGAQTAPGRTPVKMLDLGVPALVFAEHLDPVSLRFMAPEQLAAYATATPPITFRCSASMNVYSCGCLLYYLCTGGPPYTGSTLEELRAAQGSSRLTPPARINPQITPVLNALIMRALALDPSLRFASVAELAEALGGMPSMMPGRARISDVPEVVKTLPPAPDDGRDPPTSRISRPPDRAAVPQPEIVVEAHADDDASSEHDMPTLPPLAIGPESLEPISGATPIGLFSSAPPIVRERVSTPPPVQPAPPLALFTSPPMAAAGSIARSDTILTEGEAVESRLLAPYREPIVQRSRRGIGWVWPLATAACIALVVGVARFTSKPETASVRVLPPAAVGGSVNPPSTAPRVEPPRSGAIVEEPGAPPALPPQPQVIEPYAFAPENPSRLDRQRDHDRGRGHPHGRTPGRGNDGQSLAPEQDAPEPTSMRPNEPPAEPEPPEPNNNARAASLPTAAAPSPALAVKPIEPVAATPRETGSESAAPQPGLPLAADAQIQAVELRGSLPNSVVRRAIERLRGQFAACYARAAKVAGHNGFGESIVELTIDERGRARSPHAHGGGLPRLDACVTEVTSKLICDKQPDTGTVSATFRVTFRP
jgi:serine/threonine protein kinase